MTSSEEDYEQLLWPKIRYAVEQMLSPDRSTRIYFEEVHSCVYKSVCARFAERPYNDVIMHMTVYLQNVSCGLEVLEGIAHLQSFFMAMSQYQQSVDAMAPMFTYLNRFYLENKMHSTLKDELLKVFNNEVAKKHIGKILIVIIDVQSQPFVVSPSVLSELIKNLYKLNPEFAMLSPEIFSKYIPQILPSTTVSDLPNLIQETQNMQRELESVHGYTRSDRRLKRALEEIEIKGTVAYTDKNDNVNT